MGTTTFFKGDFKLNKKLDASTQAFINKLARSERLARHINPYKYGLQGEFYVANEVFSEYVGEGEVIGQHPPATQAGLWCQWVVNEEGTAIQWDNGEKFYNSAYWISYILHRILIPRGYTLEGIVNAESPDERYHIIIAGGKIKVEQGFHPDVPKPQRGW